MERVLNMAGIGILLMIGAALLLNLFNDPMAARRKDLERRLADIGTEPDQNGIAPAESKGWDRTITEKRGVWQELIPPPPPPPPPPPEPPKRPDLAQMLSGVRATRQQVGGKAKFILPDNPRGVFLGEGEKINGVSIVSFSRTEVVFSYVWREMNQELTFTMPRE